MNMNTRKTIRLWARRLPLLTVVASALIAALTYAGIGFVPVSPVWLMALLMGFMIVAINSDVGTLRPYGQDASLWPLLAILVQVLLLAPLAYDAAMGSFPEEQALPLLLTMIGAFVVGVIAIMVLQTIVAPVHEAERREFTLRQLEAEVAALSNYGALPETYDRLVALVRRQGDTMPLDELSSYVQNLTDYRKATSLMSHEPS